MASGTVQLFYRPFLICLWLWETREGDLSPLGLNSSVLQELDGPGTNKMIFVSSRGGTRKTLGM